MTKPIVVLKMPCISVNNTIIKSFVFLACHDVLVACNLASDWPRTFVQPGLGYHCFCKHVHICGRSQKKVT